MSGFAIVLPSPIDFSDSNIGQVTIQEDVDVTAISLNCENSYSGNEVDLSETVGYTPSNTSKKGVTFSIESGSEYASITSAGVLTIKSGASANNVTVKITSNYDSSITATKTIAVTYVMSFPFDLTLSNYTIRKGNITGSIWKNTSTGNFYHIMVPVNDFVGHKIYVKWDSNPYPGIPAIQLLASDNRAENATIDTTDLSGTLSAQYNANGVTLTIPSGANYAYCLCGQTESLDKIKKIQILE